MIVLKAGSKIYGAKLTAAERKAMEIEIRKEIAISEQEHSLNTDALILYQLRKQLGFGKKRLMRFYQNFAPVYHELLDYYEASEEGEGFWLIRKQLKEDVGIDLEEWSKGNYT